MNGKLLTRDEDLQKASDAFLALTHVALPLEYLKRGVVVGWFTNDQLAASFACITKPPFRVLSVLRENQLDDYVRECFAQGVVCEFNGVFVRPEFKNMVSASGVLKSAIQFFAESGMKCALFGYSNERENLSALYQRPRLSPVKLLDGEVVLPSGLLSVNNVFLGYLRSDHVAKSFAVARNQKTLTLRG
jgi:hypothetical protein